MLWIFILLPFLVLIGVFIYLLFMGVPVLYALCIFIFPIVIWGQYFFLMRRHDKHNNNTIKKEDSHDIRHELKQCPSCGGKAELCGEGMAKSIFEDGEERLFFTDFDGYTVSCEDCMRTTTFYQTPDAAVDAWNKSE